MKEATGEKKPAQGGLVMGDAVVIGEPWGSDLSQPPAIDESARAQLEQIAEQMAKWARAAFRNAEYEPKGSFGRRFIEHGAMCYFNCWSPLRQFLDASSPLPSDTQAKE